MYVLSAGTKMVAAVQRCFVFRKRWDWTISFQVCRFESPHCKNNLCICLKKHTFYFLWRLQIKFIILYVLQVYKVSRELNCECTKHWATTQAVLDTVHVTNFVQSHHCRWRTDSFTFALVVSSIFFDFRRLSSDLRWFFWKSLSRQM